MKILKLNSHFLTKMKHYHSFIVVLLFLAFKALSLSICSNCSLARDQLLFDLYLSNGQAVDISAQAEALREQRRLVIGDLEVLATRIDNADAEELPGLLNEQYNLALQVYAINDQLAALEEQYNSLTFYVNYLYNELTQFPDPCGHDLCATCGQNPCICNDPPPLIPCSLCGGYPPFCTCPTLCPVCGSYPPFCIGH